MDLSLKITNEEDIKYLSKLSENKKNEIIRTAISIGLKSLQMSEVKMDCHSYIDPIREINTESSEINTDKIDIIDVLLLSNDEKNIKIGTPYLKGVSVKAEVLEQKKK